MNTDLYLQHCCIGWNCRVTDPGVFRGKDRIWIRCFLQGRILIWILVNSTQISHPPFIFYGKISIVLYWRKKVKGEFYKVEMRSDSDPGQLHPKLGRILVDLFFAWRPVRARIRFFVGSRIRVNSIRIRQHAFIHLDIVSAILTFISREKIY